MILVNKSNTVELHTPALHLTIFLSFQWILLVFGSKRWFCIQFLVKIGNEDD